MTPLERYVRFMESVAEFDLDTLGEFIAPDVHFVDPFNDTCGIREYRRIIEDMRRQLAALQIEVLDKAVVAPDRALLRWRLSGNLTAFKNRGWSVEGCSLVRFSATGDVIEHIDYWDAARQLYESFPLIGRLMRFLRNKLSVA